MSEEANAFMDAYAGRVIRAAAQMHGCSCEIRLMGAAKNSLNDAALSERLVKVCAEKLRLPVELYYLEGFKTREIAGMLGIPENTVKTRLRAAREHLRKDLKGACFA